MVVTKAVWLKYLSHPAACLAVLPQTNKQTPCSWTIASLLASHAGEIISYPMYSRGNSSQSTMQVKIPYVLCLLECYRSDLLGIPRRRFPVLPSSAYHPESARLQQGRVPAISAASSYAACPYRDELRLGWWPRCWRLPAYRQGVVVAAQVQVKPRLLAGAEEADCGAKVGSIYICSLATSQESQGCCSSFAMSTQETRRSLKKLLKSDFCLHTGQADLTV